MSDKINNQQKTTAETMVTVNNYSNDTVENQNCQIDISLIEVRDGQVLARNLYKFLELNPTQFARWVARNIINNDFAIESADYFLDDRRSSDTMKLSIEFSKKLCMMTKSTNGENARNYFLECEKIATQPIQTKELTLADILRANNNIITQLDERNKVLEAKIVEDKPLVDFAEKVYISNGLVSITEFAKILGTGEKRLFEWLRQNGILTKANLPYQYYIDNHQIEVKERTYNDRLTGELRLYSRVYITGKGQLLIEKKYKTKIAEEVRKELN